MTNVYVDMRSPRLVLSEWLPIIIFHGEVEMMVSFFISFSPFFFPFVAPSLARPLKLTCLFLFFAPPFSARIGAKEVLPNLFSAFASVKMVLFRALPPLLFFGLFPACTLSPRYAAEPSPLKSNLRIFLPSLFSTSFHFPRLFAKGPFSCILL